MGSLFAKARCTKPNVKGKVSPEAIQAQRRRSTSFREFVKDLNYFWKSSDSSTRSKCIVHTFSTSNMLIHKSSLSSAICIEYIQNEHLKTILQSRQQEERLNLFMVKRHKLMNY